MTEYVHGKVDIEHLNDIIEQTDKGSDRDLAIILGTFVENCLRLKIEREIKLSPIFSGKQLWNYNGPLGTFSSKIEVARAFGIITDLHYSHLIVIKKIRNHCAHSLGIYEAESVSFETHPIKQHLQNLYSEKLLSLVDTNTAKTIRGSHEEIVKNEPRLIFKTIVYSFCHEYITGRGLLE